MYCPKCGKELPEGSNFCPNCGNSISSSTASPQPQTSNSHDQDAPSAERQSAPSSPQQNTPSASQESTPPVPDEKVKCPKCGAVGCTPQYKQNVSGGGYGCCSGGLGALILGPLGLLCGACGRSVKTTNNLVWICPKCGHEFQPVTNMYERGIFGLSLIGIAVAVVELFLGAYHFGPVSIFAALYGIGVIAFLIYFAIYKRPFMYTDEQREKLKKFAIAMVVLILACFLISLI